MAGYQPDTRQRLEKSTRFFARLHSFDLECPRCGDVYTIRMGTTRHNSEKHPNWDPMTARFTCTNKNCARKYILGILAWPIGKGAGAGSSTPKDQVPNPRQLAQMRKEGGGWWLPDDQAQRWPRPNETNLTLEEERPDHDDDED